MCVCVCVCVCVLCVCVSCFRNNVEVFNILEGISHSVSLPINLQACHAIDKHQWVLSEATTNRCVCVCVYVCVCVCVCGWWWCRVVCMLCECVHVFLCVFVCIAVCSCMFLFLHSVRIHQL